MHRRVDQRVEAERSNTPHRTRSAACFATQLRYGRVEGMVSRVRKVASKRLVCIPWSRICAGTHGAPASARNPDGPT